jgi:hypothetical protein
MADIFNNFFKQIARGDQIRDFKHASRLFVDNNYRLSPKSNWIYHVFFDINPQLTKIRDNNKLVEQGMLVKSIDLPKFNIQNKTLNEYNRPNIIQTKINYSDINISFHDDMANVVRGFWYDYLTYYYRDLDIGYSSSTGQVNPVHQAPSLYKDSQRELLNKFGYSPRSFDAQNEQQFIQAIRVYSLHQKKFSEYTLVNPTITSFSHGSHDSKGAEGLDCTMTVAYETVLYASGHVTPNTVRGFADLHYDKSPSPLTPAGGGTNSIMGPGGILSAVDEIVKDGSAGNFGSAAFKAFRAVEKNKNVDLRGIAKAELVTALTDVLSLKDPRDRFFIPTTGSLANNNFPGIQNASGSTGLAPGSATSNGLSINTGSLIPGLAIGAGLAASGITNPTVAAAAGVAAGAFINSSTGQNLVNTVKGAVSDLSGKLTGGSLNQVFNVDKTGKVTSSQQQPSFDFLADAVRKQQESIQSLQAIEASSQLTDVLSGLPQGISGIPGISSAATVFQTGTSNLADFTNSSSILKQTPFAQSVVPASTNIASESAKGFVTGSDSVKLTPGQSYAGNHIGSSTPPAPPDVVAI